MLWYDSTGFWEIFCLEVRQWIVFLLWLPFWPWPFPAHSARFRQLSVSCSNLLFPLLSSYSWQKSVKWQPWGGYRIHRLVHGDLKHYCPDWMRPLRDGGLERYATFVEHLVAARSSTDEVVSDRGMARIGDLLLYCKHSCWKFWANFWNLRGTAEWWLTVYRVGLRWSPSVPKQVS